MYTAIAIIVLSLVLFAYWFRFVCVLILETKRDAVGARAMRSRIRLNFLDLDQKLDRQEGGLDRLHELLDEDYRILAAVLAASNSQALERRILLVYYRILDSSFRATRRLAPVQAWSSLREMSQVLGFFATVICEDATT